MEDLILKQGGMDGGGEGWGGVKVQGQVAAVMK